MRERNILTRTCRCPAQAIPGKMFDDDNLELILAQLPLQDGISLLKTPKERYYHSVIGAEYLLNKIEILRNNLIEKSRGLFNSWKQLDNRLGSMSRHIDEAHLMQTMGIMEAKMSHYWAQQRAVVRYLRVASGDMFDDDILELILAQLLSRTGCPC